MSANNHNGNHPRNGEEEDIFVGGTTAPTTPAPPVVVRAPVPTKVQALDLELLSELAGCTTEELVEGLHQGAIDSEGNDTAIDIAGAVVDNTTATTAGRKTSVAPHARKESDGSGATSAGIEFESTIVITEEDVRSTRSGSVVDEEDDFEADAVPSPDRRDVMIPSEHSSHGGSTRSATSQAYGSGHVTRTHTHFIAKPPKTLRAPALVLATPPTLDNDGEIHHAPDVTYDPKTEHSNIHVNKHKDQFHGFLIGVGHYDNTAEFIASLTDDGEDDHEEKEGDRFYEDEEGQPLMRRSSSRDDDNVGTSAPPELHPVAFSIPVATTSSSSTMQPIVGSSGTVVGVGDVTAQTTVVPIQEGEEQAIGIKTGMALHEDGKGTSATGGGGAQLVGANKTSTEEDEMALPDPSEAAYLIQVDDGTTEEPKVYLAVPDVTAKEDEEDDDDHLFPMLDHRRESFLDRTLDFALPSDVAEVAVKTIGEEHEVRMVVERHTPMVGYFLLVMALMSMSSLGAALDVIKGAHPLLKLYWRMTSDCICFFPMALISLLRDGRPKLGRKDYASFLVASMCYMVFSGAFLISLDYTPIGTAFLFGNCHSLFLVLGKVLSGVAILCLEGTGAFVGLIGAVLCTFDAPQPIGDQQLQPLKGNAFALASALGGCGYLLLAKKLRPKVDLFVFMFCMLAVGSTLVLSSLDAAGVHYTFDRHHKTGLWGWTDITSDRLPLQLYITFVCDLIGMTGYVAVMKYFDPLVVSVVMLLEPVVATLIGLVVGVGGVPGAWTIGGGIVVTAGTLMVTAASSNKTETYNIQKALHLLRIKTSPSSSSISSSTTERKGIGMEKEQDTATTTSHSANNGHNGHSSSYGAVSS